MFKDDASSYVTQEGSKHSTGKDGLEHHGSLTSHHKETPHAKNALMAYLAFKQPDKKRREYLIPKDKAAWLEYLVQLVKRKTTIEYLSEKELRKVIIRARPNLAGKKPVYQNDPDAPICMDWSTQQTAEWIAEAGFPYLKEGFLMNSITGRRLITVDCSSLNRMGMRDLIEMQKVTAKIREMLQIPKPNMLRALMRIPPFESFLQQKVLCGKSYDALTFEKYCKQEGFNYGLLKNNKNALIPCTCEVRIVPNGIIDDDEEELVESDEEDLSLLNAPTVEYIVRNVVVRDKTVSLLIQDIMDSVFSPPDSRKYGKPILDIFKDALGTDELGVMTSQERLEFATSVANALLDELRRTTEILNDIQELQKYIKEKVTAERVKHLQECAEEFMENVMPIASLLALGELDLETIFRQEPQFQDMVKDICEVAEATTNELVPDALAFVESVIRMARKKVKEMAIPGMSIATISSVKSLVLDVLDETMDDAHKIVTNAVSPPQIHNPILDDETGKRDSEPFGAVQVDFDEFDEPVDTENIRKGYLERQEEEKKLKTLTEVGNLHLGEGQKHHTVAQTQDHLDKPHHQPRTHLTLSRDHSVASRSEQTTPNLSHSGRSHPISDASILSKHSERGDQPLHPVKKAEEKVRVNRLKVIKSMVRQDKEESVKKRVAKGTGKLNLQDGKILDFNGKVIGLAGKNFSILSEDGKTVLGFVDKTGTAYTDDGTMLGKFDLIGKKKAPTVLEQVTTGKQAKTIVGSDGRVLGSVQIDGTLLNPKGGVLGKMEPNGTVIQPNGKVVTIQGEILGDDGRPLASLRGGLAVIPNWKGPKISPGEEVWKKVLGGEAKFLIGTNGIVVGEIRSDGKIMAKDGNALGEILPGGLIIMRDGKPLQIQAKVVDSKGALVCTVVQGVTQVQKPKEVKISKGQRLSVTNSQLLAAIEENADAEDQQENEILKNIRNYQNKQNNPDNSDRNQGPNPSNNQGPNQSNNQGPNQSNNQGPNQSINQGPHQSNSQGPHQSNNQEPNQSNNQGPNQSNNQGPNHSNNEGPNQSNNQGPHQSNNQGPHQSNNQEPNQSYNQGPNQSNNQGPNQSNNQGPNQSNNQGPNRSNYQTQPNATNSDGRPGSLDKRRNSKMEEYRKSMYPGQNDLLLDQKSSSISLWRLSSDELERQILERDLPIISPGAELQKYLQRMQKHDEEQVNIKVDSPNRTDREDGDDFADMAGATIGQVRRNPMKNSTGKSDEIREHSLSMDGASIGTMNFDRNSIEERERKRIAHMKLEKLQEDWEHQEIEDTNRRKQLQLDQIEAAQRQTKESRTRKSQYDIAKKIWNDLNGQREDNGQGSDSTIGLVPSDELERLIIQREKYNRENRQHESTAPGIETEHEHLEKVKLHRRQMVEQWAGQTDGGMTDLEVTGLPKEQARLARITVDQIVSEVIQLALTHMLLEAEAGKNTYKILKALKEIQCPAASLDRENDITLWKPHLPRLKVAKNVTTAAQEVSFETAPTKPNTKEASVVAPPTKPNTKEPLVVTATDVKEEMLNKTEKILTSALKTRPSPIENSVEGKAHRHHTHRSTDPKDANQKTKANDEGVRKTDVHHHHHHHHHDEGHKSKSRKAASEVDKKDEITRL